MTFSILFPPENSAVWLSVINVIHRAGVEHGLQRVTSEGDIQFVIHGDKRSHPKAHGFAMQMHMTGLIQLDSQGWGVTHSEHQTFKWAQFPERDALVFCDGIKRDWLANGKSKLWQPQPMPTQFRDFVLVALQMPDDLVIRRYSYETMEQFLRNVIDDADSFPHRVVVKPHTCSTRERHPELHALLDEAQAHPNMAVTRENIHSLLAACRGVLTINSGVGFEAIVHGKPVAITGDADYSHVAHKAERLAGCEAWFKENPCWLSGQQFAAHYITRRCFWFDRERAARHRAIAHVTRLIDGALSAGSIPT